MVLHVYFSRKLCSRYFRGALRRYAKDKLVHGNINNFKNYNIEFENVSFAYNDKAVIENLSFNLEEGKSYALVGSSGSGKSTVAKLISGFIMLIKEA